MLKRSILTALLTLLAVALTGGSAATAQAATVTVGSVLPLGFTSEPFGEVETRFNTALPEKGANLVSPVNGTILRWRLQGAKGGPYRLRVLTPNGSGAYTATGISNAVTPSGEGLQTFTADLPIHQGDLIGVEPTHASDEIGVAPVAGASFAYIVPPPFDGATVAPSGGQAGEELELNAEVQPAPSITAIEPSSGSVSGGAAVKITGANFSSASSVRFGSMLASTFTIESDTRITASSPAATAPGFVDVTVTTLGGTSPTSWLDRFAYQGCVVPMLRGRTLASARVKLRREDCTLGRITGKRHKNARVVRQLPAAGKVLPPGAAVSVSLR